MGLSHAGVAVVGATGFIGSALMTELRVRGTSATGFTRQSLPLSSDGTPQPGLAESSTVVWAASSINPSSAENAPERVRADREALVRVLDALSGSASTPRVVLVSSGGSVYDPQEPAPYCEDSGCRPVGAYGRAKLELEQLLLAQRPGSVVIRVANAYGPGQPAAPGQGVIGHWLRAVRDGRPLELFGSRATARDYVFIDDIIAALMAIHEGTDLPDVLNIGSGRATTLAELLDMVRAVAGPFDVVQHQRRGFDVERTWLDIERADKELDWRPAVELRSGVARSWDWVSADPAR
jgi:UDP-glucose 4-epimerase